LENIMDSPDKTVKSDPLPLPPLLAAILRGRVGSREFDLVAQAVSHDAAITRSPVNATEGKME
jgi:hypothetical protein